MRPILLIERFISEGIIISSFNCSQTHIMARQGIFESSPLTCLMNQINQRSVIRMKRWKRRSEQTVVWSDGVCDHDAVIFSRCCLRDVVLFRTCWSFSRIKVYRPVWITWDWKSQTYIRLSSLFWICFMFSIYNTFCHWHTITHL